MELTQIAAGVLAAFAGGAACSALINAIHDRWKFKAERKAKAEDREQEKNDRTEEIREIVEEFRKSEEEQNRKLDERLHAMEKSKEAQAEALKLILLDRILYLGQAYINKGEISFDDRRRLHAMHSCYHKGLGGNGDADLVMEAVDELQLKK